VRVRRCARIGHDETFVAAIVQRSERRVDRDLTGEPAERDGLDAQIAQGVVEVRREAAVPSPGVHDHVAGLVLEAQLPPVGASGGQRGGASPLRTSCAMAHPHHGAAAQPGRGAQEGQRVGDVVRGRRCIDQLVLRTADEQREPSGVQPAVIRPRIGLGS
jgi:hypothetical protein